MMRVRLTGLALLLMLLAASAAAGTGGPVTPPRSATLHVSHGETILEFPATAAGATSRAQLRAAVALPGDVTTARPVLLQGRAGGVELVGELRRARGHVVALVAVLEPGPGALRVALRHDGDWTAKVQTRLASPALAAGLPGSAGPGGLKSAIPSVGGSYVVVTGPQYVGALQPLVDWKTRKGWPVVVATTDETGNTNDGIRAWLQAAYDDWEVPPEHVLLVGDVDAVPTWNISGNVTDLPYQLLDGDDWLPDLMLGRFSVSNQSECQAMVAKTVAYERDPDDDDDGWFTRSVMVAGQYASTTPMHTVRFCGEQLAGLGFDPLVPVTPVQLDGSYIVSPYIPREEIGIPQNMGPVAIKNAIDTGCGFVVYRGWAYGTAGWEPPHYTVDEIPSLANGAMTPIVMSFVCLNGDFSAAEPCFGEVFTRTGGATPDAFKGAVAFIGNGEHWSHTRFNDAMAISVFERITDREVTTLGGLLNAGKLRFLEYYPGELDEVGDEESVEFYFHIYTLLGDPELNFHRAAPAPLTVTYPDEELAAGTTHLEVAVDDATGNLSGARIGVVQDGQLLGRAVTGADGRAGVVLDTPVAEGPVHLTVTHPDRHAFEATIDGDDRDVFIALDDPGLDDDSGNADGTLNPGETIAMLATMRNDGIVASSAATVTFEAGGPVTVAAGAAELSALAPGATATLNSPIEFTVDAAAEDGALVEGVFAVDHASGRDDSGFRLAVAAPDLQIGAAAPGGETWVEPGTTTDLTLTVRNEGTQDTSGGTLDLVLTPLDGVSLLTTSVPFGAVAAGGSTACGPVSVSVDAAVPAGRSLALQATATCDDGAVQTRGLAIAVGRGDVGEPAGPDEHGYYAYDSADYLYGDLRPVYRWRELSPTFGGPGDTVAFDADNYDTEVALDLPFTFTFYGEDYDRLRVSDNGWISFQDEDDYYNFYNWPLPSEHGSGAVVAPFWDNLTPEPNSDPASDPVGLDSDGVWAYHDDDAGEFIIEWSRMRHIYAEVHDLQTFQVVLRDPAVHATPTGDGEILFFYKQVADNDHLRMWASVGIESPDETDGLQLTYDGVRSRGTMTFGPGQAIRLTTAAPVREPLDVRLVDRVDAGGQSTLRWELADTRPVVGWHVLARTAAGVHRLTEATLPAGTRAATVSAGAETELVLEALLPHGVRLEAARALPGSLTPRFALQAPTPNPLRGEATLAFSLPTAGHVSLRVFDVRGRLVRTLRDDRARPARPWWSGGVVTTVAGTCPTASTSAGSSTTDARSPAS